jgi:hypothetical protein
VSIFNLRCVVGIDVIAMEAPADNLARIKVGTSAFAMGSRRVQVSRKLDLDRPFGRWLVRRRLPLLVFVLRALTEFHGAVAMVIAVHGQPADAFAVFPAFEAVPRHVAGVKVRVFVFDNVEFRHEPLLKPSLFG